MAKKWWDPDRSFWEKPSKHSSNPPNHKCPKCDVPMKRRGEYWYCPECGLDKKA